MSSWLGIFLLLFLLIYIICLTLFAFFTLCFLIVCSSRLSVRLLCICSWLWLCLDLCLGLSLCSFGLSLLSKGSIVLLKLESKGCEHSISDIFGKLTEQRRFDIICN